MLRNLLFLLICIIEWVLFLFVLLLSILFNLTNIFNLIYIDMPFEEPISLSSNLSGHLFVVLGLGLIIFIYIKYLRSNQVYRMVRKFMWGGLLGLHFLWCMLWLLVGGFNYSANDWILLLAITFVCFILIIQIMIMLLRDRKVAGA